MTTKRSKAYYSSWPFFLFLTVWLTAKAICGCATEQADESDKAAAESTTEAATPVEANAPAKSPDADQKWAGTGRLFDTHGVAQGDYKVELTRHRVGESRTDQKILVTLPDGRTKHFEQTLEEGEHGFKMTGDGNEGGGFELGDGLLLSYSEGKDGSAMAQTIVLDGEDRMRIVRTELKNGQATRFFRETYARQ